MDDYYQLLQVSPTAERHTIEAAHRRLSAATDDPARQAKLDEALAVLTDPAGRKRYDRDRTASRSTTRGASTGARKSQGSSGLSGKRLAFTAIGAVVGIAALGGVLVMALGGDGDDDADATPTGSVDEFGEPPVLGDSIVDVSPGHATRIPQEDTLSPDPQRPENGVCINASFIAEPGITSQWFHILFDGELVTPETTWILTQDPDVEQPEGGVLCYAPAGGFELGIHEVQALVQDPAGAQPRQVANWAFEVVP